MIDAGCYALALWQDVGRLGCRSWLVMRNPKLARAIRTADPYAAITLRPDWGKDNEQVDASLSPESEGRRWALDVIRPQVEEVGAGVYTATLGVNEMLALPFDWLVAFDRAVCLHVQYGQGMPQGWRQLPYYCFSAQVGYVDSWQIEPARPILEIAAGSNWHAYLRPWAKSFEPDQEQWHACRWLGLAPLILGINPRHRFLVGECGTYYPPAATGIDKGEEARLQVALARHFREQAAARGYQLDGVHCYGLGLEGDQRETWDLTEQIGVLAAANAEGQPDSGVVETPQQQEDTTVNIEEQYPQQFAEWKAAGGVANNFRAHLIGIGAIQPTKEDVATLIGNARSSLNQVENAVRALPFG